MVICPFIELFFWDPWQLHVDYMSGHPHPRDQNDENPRPYRRRHKTEAQPAGHGFSMALIEIDGYGSIPIFIPFLMG